MNMCEEHEVTYGRPLSDCEDCQTYVDGNECPLCGAEDIRDIPTHIRNGECSGVDDD